MKKKKKGGPVELRPVAPSEIPPGTLPSEIIRKDSDNFDYTQDPESELPTVNTSHEPGPELPSELPELSADQAKSGPELPSELPSELPAELSVADQADLVPKKTRKKRITKPKEELMKTFFCGGNQWNRIKMLKKQKKVFRVSYTSTSCLVRTGNRQYMYCGDGGMPFWELNLQKQIKKHILTAIENGVELTQTLTSKDVSYYRFSEESQNMSEGECLGECVEFDIDKAYYRCAFNLGFMDRNFYNKCVGLKKKVRLRLIGSIATKRRIFNYENGKIQGIPDIIENPVLRNAWFHIVDRIGKCMDDFAQMCGDRFVMYWVDGIYLKGKAEDYTEILKVISERWGFDFKVEGINDIVYDFDKELNSGRLLIYKKKLEGLTGFNKRDHTPFYMAKNKLKSLYAREDELYALEQENKLKIGKKKSKVKKFNKRSGKILGMGKLTGGFKDDFPGGQGDGQGAVGANGPDDNFGDGGFGDHGFGEHGDNQE
jgi:hypothetical protein